MDKIPLAEMLIELRAELERAQFEGAGKHMRFKVESIDLELQVTASKEKEGGGGFKFWILSGEGKAKAAAESLQKLNLKLQAIELDPATGQEKPALISDDRKVKPGRPNPKKD